MSFSDYVLQSDEKAIYSLRELYRKHGYSHYKVSKFEEYDLYAHNKNFLVSENILSFTDTDGKLMALKPDVTLSIVKNVDSDKAGLNKLYYNEYVYRTSAGNNGFREIMQTGLECIGKVDIFSECEVVMLAMKSLETISENYVLDVSHMGLIQGFIELAGIAPQKTSEFLSLIGAKNIPELKAFCIANKVSADMTESICSLAGMYLPVSEALDHIEAIVSGEKMEKAYDELKRIAEAMALYGLEEKLFVDFSVINDMNYYDGIIFSGFIMGIPDSVLSGGRYDRLLNKLGKNSEAIGFAVYLDRLERFGYDENEFDIDTLVVYGEDTDMASVIKLVGELVADGDTVRIAATDKEDVRYRRIIRV